MTVRIFEHALRLVITWYLDQHTSDILFQTALSLSQRLVELFLLDFLLLLEPVISINHGSSQLLGSFRTCFKRGLWHWHAERHYHLLMFLLWPDLINIFSVLGLFEKVDSTLDFLHFLGHIDTCVISSSVALCVWSFEICWRNNPLFSLKSRLSLLFVLESKGDILTRRCWSCLSPISQLWWWCVQDWSACCWGSWEGSTAGNLTSQCPRSRTWEGRPNEPKVSHSLLLNQRKKWADFLQICRWCVASHDY